ncbi:MAG: hypothetical protein ABI578_06535 [Chloroflexota bacterium]
MRIGWRFGSTLSVFKGGVLLAGALLLSACQATPPSASFGSSNPVAQPSWPARADAMALTQQAGLVAEAKEYLVTHHHAHLDLFVDGQRVTVPAGIGIAIGAAGVSDEQTPDGTAHSYFVHALCPAACLSPLHTHDPSGIIHEESQQANHAPYSLGQFFAEWGLKLDANCVGDYCKPDVPIHIYLNGKASESDPAKIPLENHLEIAIVIGQPPAVIPPSWEFLDP